MAAFQQGIDWLWNIDPYAGLLISRHRTGLWRSRYGSVAYPAGGSARALTPEVEAFIAMNEERQERALASADRARFLVNYRKRPIGAAFY